MKAVDEGCFPFGNFFIGSKSKTNSSMGKGEVVGKEESGQLLGRESGGRKEKFSF